MGLYRESDGTTAVAFRIRNFKLLRISEKVAMPNEETNRPVYWFALAVKPRFEKPVARTLERKGCETFLPFYHKQHQNWGSSQDFEAPLFPGYVCCRFDIGDQGPILTTPGVIEILGSGSTPIAVADIEVTSLQTAMRARVRVQPFPFVRSGQRVRIESGDLAGVEGIVMSFSQTLRLVLSITLLQKSALFEIERDQVSFSECSCVAAGVAQGDLE